MKKSKVIEKVEEIFQKYKMDEFISEIDFISTKDAYKAGIYDTFDTLFEIEDDIPNYERTT